MTPFSLSRSAARFLLPSLIAFSLLFSSAAAISSQDDSLNATASEVSQLVHVSGNLNFDQLLPGHEYRAPIVVSWAVPDASLANLNEPKVSLFVLVEPGGSNSWIYFKDSSGNRVASLSFQLVCVVKSGTCDAPASTLSHTVDAYYSAPLHASYPHQDGVSVHTSFTDFPHPGASSVPPTQLTGASERLQQSASDSAAAINAAVAALKAATAAGLQVSDSARILIDQTYAAYAKGDYVGAKSLANQVMAALPSPTPTPAASPLTGLFLLNNLSVQAFILVLFALGVGAVLYSRRSSGQKQKRL